MAACGTPGCPLCRISQGRIAIVRATSPPAPVPPAPRTGTSGFDNAGLIAGAMTGYRWWTMDAPPLHLNPAQAGEHWQPGLLRGMKGPWEPGVNQAGCRPWGNAPVHCYEDIPVPECGCGWWAYWDPQPHDLHTTGLLPVIGVIRGTGQVLAGPLGFRAQKARIIALHLPFRIGSPDLSGFDPGPDLDHGHSHQYGRHNPWWNHPQFPGKVINYGQTHETAPLQRSGPLPPAPPTAAEIAEAEDRAGAWMAVIEDRLAIAYPDAEVCVTMRLLLAKYPPDPQYPGTGLT